MNGVKSFAVRTKFNLKTKVVKWFPRHMNKGLRGMERTVRKVDCIIEVHDSRIPFSGRNLNFIRSLSSLKPHVLVLNKLDLLDIRYQNKIRDQLERDDNNSRCLFVDSIDPNARINGFSDILPTVVDLIRGSNRFNREDITSYNLMIIGIPNVGKSTIINKIRNTRLGVAGKATSTGATPGVTRSVLERIKINANPPVYLYDTPGVLEPKIDKSLETTMRCALCGTLSDQLIGIENIADYLLFWLNRHKNHSYVELLGLDTPSDNITEVLVKGSVFLNYMIETKERESGLRQQRPDMGATAQAFVTAFRRGKLGRVLLDDDFF